MTGSYTDPSPWIRSPPGLAPSGRTSGWHQPPGRRFGVALSSGAVVQTIGWLVVGGWWLVVGGWWWVVGGGWWWLVGSRHNSIDLDRLRPDWSHFPRYRSQYPTLLPTQLVKLTNSQVMVTDEISHSWQPCAIGLHLSGSPPSGSAPPANLAAVNALPMPGPAAACDADPCAKSKRAITLWAGTTRRQE